MLERMERPPRRPRRPPEDREEREVRRGLSILSVLRARRWQGGYCQGDFWFGGSWQSGSFPGRAALACAAHDRRDKKQQGRPGRSGGPWRQAERQTDQADDPRSHGRCLTQTSPASPRTIGMTGLSDSHSATLGLWWARWAQIEGSDCGGGPGRLTESGSRDLARRRAGAGAIRCTRTWVARPRTLLPS